MDNEKVAVRRKAEEDAYRNSDSMLPAKAKGNDEANEFDDDRRTVLKTRRQRRLEQNGHYISDVETAEYRQQDMELREKARRFSLMVFNDPDASNFSSLTSVYDEDPTMKTFGSGKNEENVDLDALNARVDVLLARFLKTYNKYDY